MAQLTVAAQIASYIAGREAEGLGSAHIEREHLLIALCKADSFSGLIEGDMSGLGSGEVRQAQAEASGLLKSLQAAGFDHIKARRRARDLWLAEHPQREPFSGHRTPACRALFAAAERRQSTPVTMSGLFRAIAEDPGPLLERILTELGVDRAVLVQTLDAAAPPAVPPAGPERWGRELTRLAQEGRLHAAIGRNEETKTLARILLQAGKSSPILVGEAGVGKTAIVEGLAHRIATAQVPPALKRVRIIEVSLGSLVAGTSRRGEFEERVQELLQVAENDRDLVIFIDEIHMLLGAGVSGGMDAAGLLKPALARGALRCIGATTVAEYRRHFEGDAALSRRFQPVWIDEPSRDQAIAILQGLRPSLEEHYGLPIGPAVVEAAVDLSIRHLPERRLPDKAIDLMNQACSRVVLSTFSGQVAPAGRQVDRTDVVGAVSDLCRIPVEELSEDESARLLRMEDELRTQVVGQDAAVSALADTIRTARAGLRDPRRPLGVFLLLGPTGTGKTELSKTLAAFLFGHADRLIRIDMSEYSERHQVARLVGAPPGYVGHDRGGQLTEAIRARPYAVVLFDEVDKAHPDVHALFLQMFDEGTLTDGHGRVASFRDAVLMMTANVPPDSAGSSEPIGFGSVGAAKPKEAPDPRRQLASRLFRPEIVNRIDRVLQFEPLSIASIGRITEKFCRRTNQSLEARRIVLTLSPAATDLIARRGYSPDDGARALDRMFQRLVEEPLGRLILEGRVIAGDRVHLDVTDDQLRFSTERPG